MVSNPSVRSGGFLRGLARIATTTVLLVSAAYAGSVAFAAIKAWATGAPINLGLLATSPLDRDALLYIPMIAGVVVLEALCLGWRTSPGRRSFTGVQTSHRTDLFYVIAQLTGFVKFLTAAMSFGLSEAIDGVAQAYAWPIAADLPLWAAVPLLYVVGDFMLYWAHRIMHAPLLWPLHATHHSARDLTCLTSTRLHPLEQFVGVIAIAVPFVMLGFSADAVLICSLAMTAQGVLSHSSVPVPLWVQRVFHGPDTHRVHHGMDPAMFNTNFARLAMWDQLFGTFLLMDARGVATGVDDPRYDTGRPMRDMWTAVRITVEGLREAAGRMTGRPSAARIAAAALVGACLLATAVAAAQPTVGESQPDEDMLRVLSVAAEGTQFRVTLSDGRVLRSPDLVGASLFVGTTAGPIRVRIDAVERDPEATTGDVWLHTLTIDGPDGARLNLCQAGPDGRAQAFPLASRVRADGGTENTSEARFDLLCSAGARAKCVRFGYRPWVSGQEDIYNACTRMVRGDYCGQGEGTTNTGTLIDRFDDRNIQVADNLPDQAFEAGWTAAGAVCVAHVRVKGNTSLDRLAASCPRLAGKLGDACTLESARSAGAELFNRSRP